MSVVNGFQGEYVLSLKTMGVCVGGGGGGELNVEVTLV